MIPVSPAPRNYLTIGIEFDPPGHFESEHISTSPFFSQKWHQF